MHPWASPASPVPRRRRWWRYRPTSTGGTGRADALRAVRPDDASTGSGCRLRCAPRSCPHRDAGLGERAVHVRRAPPIAGRAGRAPVRGGDDVVDAQQAVRQGPRRLVMGWTPPYSSTSTSRPTRCTSRSSARDLAGGLASAQPERADDILFGAAVSLAMDELGAQHMMDSCAAERSSLRVPA